MSLKDALNQPYEPKRRICTMALIKEKLSKDDIEALNQALNDESIPTAFIYRALKSEGHVIHDKSLGRHRRKECRCDFK